MGVEHQRFVVVACVNERKQSVARGTWSKNWAFRGSDWLATLVAMSATRQDGTKGRQKKSHRMGREGSQDVDSIVERPSSATGVDAIHMLSADGFCTVDETLVAREDSVTPLLRRCFTLS